MAPDAPAPATEWITNEDVSGFVAHYVLDNGLADQDQAALITGDTDLAELGLDSLATAELLLSARAQLVAQGRLDPEATLLELPIVTTVADLGGLLRSLGPA